MLFRSTFLEANHALCKRLKYSRDEILKMNPLDIEVSPDPAAGMGYSKSDMVVLSDDYLRKHQDSLARRPAKRLVERLLKDRHIQYERVFEDRDGDSIPVEIDARLLNLGNRQIVASTAYDVSQRRLTEQALDESKRRFNDFFMRSPIGIVIYDARRKLVDVNRSCLKMFGTTAPSQFSTFDLLDNPFISTQVKAKILKGESVRYEMKIDFDDARENTGFATNRTGTAYFDVMINNMGPGHNFSPRGYFAQVQDISERRKAEEELRENEKQLRQAEKMEAIGSLAGGIAHDFNNILTPIVGYAELTMRLCKDDERVTKCMSGIIKAGTRAKELIGQILTHCRGPDKIDENELQPTIVTPILKEVISLQKRSLPEHVAVKRILKAKNDTVMGNATKLHQIFMNICTNAGHAMAHSTEGLLEVSLTNVMLDRKAVTRHPELRPGNYLHISIRDTGTGMDQQTAEKIFEPFFTTKKRGEGTGMGLSVVQGIIGSFRGSISVDTLPGEGTTFHIFLPVVKQETETLSPSSQEETNLEYGNECIAVIDDEEEILEVTRNVLESIGYTVITAGSPSMAMTVFKRDPNKFDLVIVDQIMPLMTGEELALEMVKMRPDLPVILCTGYPVNEEKENMADCGVRAVLTKPLVTTDLAKTVRELLDGKHSMA